MAPAQTRLDPAEATTRIDASLAALPADQRALLDELRRTIATAAPDAVETISYGMPAFRYRGRALVSYSAFKDHCSFFPMSGAVTEAHKTELDGFVFAKGTIRFTPAHPLPAELVRAMVRDRVVQIDATAKPR